MDNRSDGPTNDEIARVAHAIWVSEGRPEGCDREHWIRAQELIASGQAEDEFPGSTRSRDADESAQGSGEPASDRSDDETEPRRTAATTGDIREEASRRYSKLSSDETEKQGSGTEDNAGPRNPTPIPHTKSDGYAEAPDEEDAAPDAGTRGAKSPRARGDAKRKTSQKR